MSLAAAILAAQAVLPLALPKPPPLDPCPAFDRTVVPPSTAKRKITLRDQATMADIGRSDPFDAPSPFGVSPDGTSIAFVIRRANPDANAYCQRLVVMPLDASAAPRELDRGGAFIRPTFSMRSFPALRAGWAKVITPRWSPDGRTVAYLKREHGSTQVWGVAADGGSAARQLTRLPDDVEDFAWDADGKGLVATSRPGLREQTEAIDRESRNGFLFDARFSPQFASRPIPTGPLATAFTHVDLDTGAMRAASKAEAALVNPGPATGSPAAALLYVKGPHGAAAWTEAKNPGKLIPITRILLKSGDGATQVCDTTFCEGAQHMWWSGDGTLLILQKTGWADSQTALLRWMPGQPAPVRLFVTDDAFSGCAMPVHEIICMREGSVQPRRIVGIDPATGRQRIVYDPNPLLRDLELGKVTRFHLRNAYGAESIADLVLPPRHKPGEKHPLVVVQYTSEGFLRGGTDDEVPIQVLAAHGFAVLSFGNPPRTAGDLQARSASDIMRSSYSHWQMQRSIESSLELAVKKAVATGAVDPARMGISGFSGGTSTAQWALINSNLFKVASLGACCEDLWLFPAEAGWDFEDATRAAGYHWWDPLNEAHMKPMSLIENVDRIKAPILVQVGDSEYRIGLDTLAVFRLHHKPIEMYVFENEPHFKWQPAHRFAMYRRVTQWFDFWLRHRKDCEAQYDDQYARWQTMAGAPAANLLTCRRTSSSLP